ncbi:Alpha-ribazole phosphatase [Fusobacterium necrogenes]|uniref:Alpha-ribazole phosphatase n=1 Tax=Fusobacterium necrogenes TaxID=858 RepID=A0A377GXT9_9FUSO|nr:histidine phosphatase family protein [Fusobacterium necrogenes]STO31745.1 Alpha-ribazole phosphatase [Fusobacterium necrogenes]
MKIYFIRHGETVWNTLRIFQGSSNSPLTEKGKKQAKKLGERLKNIEFTSFYSSPLGRTLETSRLIIGSKNIKIKTIDEFKEISVGKMEGVSREEFKTKFPEQFHNFFFNPKDYDPTPYSGETFSELLNRVEKGLKKVTDKHKKDDIVVIVTHGMTLKGIFKIIKNVSFDELGKLEVPQNTSLSIVDYTDGKYTIEMFSDISHLEENEYENY